MKKIIAIIGILAIVGIGGAIGALYTQTWNPLWNPFRPAPEVVLAEMALKMEGIKIVHSDAELEIELKNKEEFSILVEISSDGDQTDSENPKGKGDLDIRFSSEGIEVSAGMEFITVGQTQYFKLTTFPDIPLPPAVLGGLDPSMILDVVRGQWIKIDQESIKNLFEMFGQEYPYLPSEEEQKELMDKLADLLKGKKFYKVKEELADVKIGDKMTYHYLLTLEKEGIKELIPEMMKTMTEYYLVGGLGPGMSSEEEMKETFEEELPKMIDEFFEKVGEITFEVWIGQKDKYLYKAKLVEKEIDFSKFEKELSTVIMPVSPGKVLISGEINFSKFNQPVEIEPPAEFKTLEEISQSIMMQFLMMSGIPPIDEMITIPEIPQMAK